MTVIPPLKVHTKMSRARSHKFLHALGVSLLSLSFAAPSYAQSTFATVQGTVLDSSGAIIPDAIVTITSEETGTVETLHSNSVGEYRAFDLNAGTYTVVISHPGFGDQTIAHQTILARQVLRIDGKLAAGSLATTIDVTAGLATLSDDPTISHSRSSDEINTLALNFRATDNTSPLYVATLTPGVQTDPSGNISVAGGFAYTTSYSIDGISTVNVRRNGPSANLFPSVESISEFKVNSANNDAEFGQPSDITVTTKGGGDKFHGGVYEFLQNSYFNASNPLTQSTPRVRANDFGAYIGGPLFTGHRMKGKTFFFGDYEGTRRPEAGSISISVPTAAFRSGDLSSLCTAPNTFVNGLCTGAGSATVPAGPQQQLYQPFSATPYLNNQVPVNASSLSLVNALYPVQNVPGAAANFQENFPGVFTVNGGDARIDENFTDKHHLWVRAGGKNVTQTGTDGSTSYDPINGIFTNTNRVRNFVADYSWTITPNILNELRGGESISDLRSGYPFAAQGAAVYAAAGITGLPTPPPSGGVPALNFLDGSFPTNNQDGRPEVTKNLTYNISDAVTIAHGRHAIKGGYDYEHFHFRDILDFTNGDQYGDYYFSGQVSSGAFAGVAGATSSFADFIAGFPVATDYSVDGPDVLPFSHSHGIYAQDSWKLLPNLTINYGLRYEIHPPFDDATHQLANFDPSVPGGRVVVQGQTGLNLVLPAFAAAIGGTPIVTNQQAGLPATLRHTYYGDIDPRFGFTYQPYKDGNTVIHAGVGAYTVPVLGSVLYSLAGVATSNYLNFQDSATNILHFPDPFTDGTVVPDFRRANQIDLKDPRQIQWNGSIEQQIGFSSVFRLSYTGSHTTQLIQSPDLNQVQPNTVGYSALTATPALRAANLKYPNFNAVLTRSNGPSAKYEALTAEVERRYAKGLTMDVNYTWAKDTSNALGAVPSTLTAENGATILNAYNLHADYGPVIYVARNRFVGTFQYELPYGRGQRFGGDINRGVNLVAGGWSVAGIFLDHSGHFLTPSFSGYDPSGTGVLSRGVTTAQRPDCTGISPSLSGRNRNGYFNPEAFTTKNFVDATGKAIAIGRFGNCPVGILTGPGTVTFAGTAGKNFAITERFKLRYEAQVANLFNHTNLGDPSTNISSSNFGKITNVQDANTSYGPSAGPRNIQMSLRLTF